MFICICLFYRRIPSFNEPPYVGQNIKLKYSTKTFDDYPAIPIEKSVNAWFGEIKDFPASSREPFMFTKKPVIGHYTQLVWADTYKVILI